MYGRTAHVGAGALGESLVLGCAGALVQALLAFPLSFAAFRRAEPIPTVRNPSTGNKQNVQRERNEGGNCVNNFREGRLSFKTKVQRFRLRNRLLLLAWRALGPRRT